MESERNAAFAAWIEAEAAAYGAIHVLHQRSCGGRVEVSGEDMEKVARLRRDAEARFADLQGSQRTANGGSPAVLAPLRTLAAQRLMRAAASRRLRSEKASKSDMADLCGYGIKAAAHAQ